MRNRSRNHGVGLPTSCSDRTEVAHELAERREEPGCRQDMDIDESSCGYEMQQPVTGVSKVVERLLVQLPDERCRQPEPATRNEHAVKLAEHDSGLPNVLEDLGV